MWGSISDQCVASQLPRRISPVFEASMLFFPHSVSVTERITYDLVAGVRTPTHGNLMDPTITISNIAPQPTR
jgi:hypothetical protein